MHLPPLAGRPVLLTRIVRKVKDSAPLDNGAHCRFDGRLYSNRGAGNTSGNVGVTGALAERVRGRLLPGEQRRRDKLGTQKVSLAAVKEGV